jgi:serine/threonine protein phosphatase 1
LADRCRLIPIFGDHEAMLLDALGPEAAVDRWLQCGGVETLRSYGVIAGSNEPLAEVISESHREFLASCVLHHETERHFFVHAGYEPELPLSEQPELALLWRVTDKRTAKPHSSGKTAIVGHTPQRSGKPLDLEFLICIDTNCARGGWLTALEINTRSVWQSNQQGKVRLENL